MNECIAKAMHAVPCNTGTEEHIRAHGFTVLENGHGREGNSEGDFPAPCAIARVWGRHLTFDDRNRLRCALGHDMVLYGVSDGPRATPEPRASTRSSENTSRKLSGQ